MNFSLGGIQTNVCTTLLLIKNDSQVFFITLTKVLRKAIKSCNLFPKSFDNDLNTSANYFGSLMLIYKQFWKQVFLNRILSIFLLAPLKILARYMKTIYHSLFCTSVRMPIAQPKIQTLNGLQRMHSTPWIRLARLGWPGKDPCILRHTCTIRCRRSRVLSSLVVSSHHHRNRFFYRESFFHLPSPALLLP